MWGLLSFLDSGLLEGLVTDRQIATKVVAAGKDPTRVNANEFMTKNPVLRIGESIHCPFSASAVASINES